MAPFLLLPLHHRPQHLAHADGVWSKPPGQQDLQASANKRRRRKCSLLDPQRTFAFALFVVLGAILRIEVQRMLRVEAVRVAVGQKRESACRGLLQVSHVQIHESQARQ